MIKRAQRGFTLIELLTVIAIIGILAAMVVVGAPRVIEKAKIARMDNSLNQIRTALVAYYSQHGTYPPAYGYLSRAMLEDAAAIYTLEDKFILEPYMSAINMQGVEDVYDEFSESYDANKNDFIDLLEFQPIPQKDLATEAMFFPDVLYNGNNLPGQTQQMLNSDVRPFFYFPVNTRQFKTVRRYWVENGDWYAQAYDGTDERLKDIVFPAANYDAFVLVGVGPGNDTYGVVPAGEPIVPNSPNNAGEDIVYHVAALRAYFLATRDLNQNNELDFDFVARTQRDEGAAVYDVAGQTVTNELPVVLSNDPVRNQLRNSYGPYIYVFEQ